MNLQIWHIYITLPARAVGTYYYRDIFIYVFDEIVNCFLINFIYHFAILQLLRLLYTKLLWVKNLLGVSDGVARRRRAGVRDSFACSVAGL